MPGSLDALAPPPRRLDRIVVVMPAYNAEATLERTFRDLPEGLAAEVILVDDVSRDRTVEIARRLGITTIRHEANTGYGGNQKTCYAEALARGADAVVMVHPDYQYDARVAGAMVTILRNGVCDVVLGSRIRTRREALQSGMPPWKYVANRALTFLENVVLGQNVGDFHTGMRAYTREVLETIPFERNSDDFVFDTQFLVQAVHFGFRIGDVPVPCRYFKEASSINFRRSVRYGFGTLAALGCFLLQRLRAARFAAFERAERRP
ncbi:MAG TPA: glycosyltransferase family 2 protein [Planctomycetota bacterium]|nr:glycosyltransferase family 2 protein [Planctomycetota bacterium]